MIILQMGVISIVIVGCSATSLVATKTSFEPQKDDGQEERAPLVIPEESRFRFLTEVALPMDLYDQTAEEFEKRFDPFQKRFDYYKRFDPFQKRFDGYMKRFDPFNKRFDVYMKRFDTF